MFSLTTYFQYHIESIGMQKIKGIFKGVMLLDVLDVLDLLDVNYYWMSEI